MPGRAWLEMTVDAATPTAVRATGQRAVFHPHGLAGHLYWWSVAPFHGSVFGGMARNITRAAEREAKVGAGERDARRDAA